MSATNWFDEQPAKPFILKSEPWAEEPPLPDSEDDYGDPRVVRFERPAKTETSVDALWHADNEWTEADIPLRPWIVPGYIMRGSVSLLAGAGSAGKSSILKAWAISLALNIPFHRFRPNQPMRVLTYNVEDNLHEERRRISATLRIFGPPHDRPMPADLVGKVRIVGPAHIGTLVTRDAATGYTTATVAMEQLERMIEQFKPDVVFLDPLVELHTAEENDNTGLRSVVAYFRSLAIRHDIGVVIAHHTRKGAVTPGDPDAVRGAGAIVGAARVVHTVCAMTEDEAKKCDIKPDRRRFYFRLDSAKSNYAPMDEAEWFERKPFMLDNGEEVAAAAPWDPPSPWDGLGMDTAIAILDQIDAGLDDGERYTLARQSGDRWAGLPVMKLAGKNEAHAARIIKRWTDEGVLLEGEYTSPTQRKKKACLMVDSAKISEMRRDMWGNSGE